VDSKTLAFGSSHERPKSKGKQPPKCLHGNTFVSFGAKRFSSQQKFGQDKNGNPNYGQEEELFFH
jgi:hypothetical protein